MAESDENNTGNGDVDTDNTNSNGTSVGNTDTESTGADTTGNGTGGVNGNADTGGGGGNDPPDAPRLKSVFPEPTMWSYLIILVVMIAILLGVAEVSKAVFRARAKEMTKEFKLSTKTPPTECKIGDDTAKQDFILKQRGQNVELGDGHLLAGSEFGAYFFANVAILGVFGLMATISLLIITKLGFSEANGHVIAIFVLSAGIGITYQGFFGVYQQKVNIDRNWQQSTRYGQLVDEIDTFCSTGKLTIAEPEAVLLNIALNSKSLEPLPDNAAGGNQNTGNQTQPPPQPAAKVAPFYVGLTAEGFILYVDTRMKKYREFEIAFDEKSVESLTNTSRLPGF